MVTPFSVPQSVEVIDHVLRHVDQTTGQVTGVRGLQRRIRQALTSTVGRVEVLQHVQAFAEVRLDRRLDDRAVRTRHQAAHTGQLTNLRHRTTRAGVGHDVQRVHRLLVDRLAFGIVHLLGTDTVDHRLGNEFVGARPDVDDLVVALAGGDQTRLVLLLDLDHFLLGLFQDRLLLGRDDHVIDADRDAGAGGEAEAGVHQLIGEHHGVLQTQAAVAGVDQARDVLLGQLGVGQRERQTFRHDFEPAARGRRWSRPARSSSVRVPSSATFTCLMRTLTLACSSTARLS